ncbi:unnamed protein product, partial [marine sediment metagenome]
AEQVQAPSLAYKIDVAFPLPIPGPIEPAPVTTATFPFNLSLIFSPLFVYYSDQYRNNYLTI